MLIRFIGPAHVVREWGLWTFRRDQAHDVPAETAVQMLTTPGEAFEIAPWEPLLAVVSADVAGQLALAGVASIQELAGLAPSNAGQVARAMGVKRATVERWMQAAVAWLATPGEAAQMVARAMEEDGPGLTRRG